MAAPQPAPTAPENSEPAVSRAGLTSAITAVVLLAAGYVQQHTGLVTADDLANLAKALAFLSPLAAAYLIRKLVVPVKKADAAASFFMAAGYAQGQQDQAAEPQAVHPDVARAIIDAHEAEQRAARNAAARARRAKAS